MTVVNWIGVFGTSGTALKAVDIAWALGVGSVGVARNESEMGTWSFTAQVIPEQGTG